jgi:hypothetical protein
MKITEYQIGKQIPIAGNINEGLIALLTRDNLSLLISFRDPTEDEIRNFYEGALRLGLYQSESLPFITLRLGDKVVGDCTIDATLQPDDVFGFINNPIEEVSMGHIFFVNERDRVLMGIRNYSYHKTLITKIRSILEEQLENPNYEATRIMSRVYDKYSDSFILYKASESYRMFTQNIRKSLYFLDTTTQGE